MSSGRCFALFASALLVSCAIATSPAAADTPFGQTPFTTQLHKVPPPPPEPGCYRPAAGGGWRSVACATQAYIAQHIPHPELLAGVGETTSTQTSAPPFQLGDVSAIPLVGGSETDNKYGKGYYSLQDNVMFYGNNGHPDGVQFTDQSGGGWDNICVWQVDVKTQKYTPVCLPIPISVGPVIIVEGWGLGGLLNTIAQDLWGNTLGVVSVGDMYGLEKKGRWNNNSGSVLGYGNGSEAVFTKTEEQIQVQATSCMDDAGFVAFSVSCSPTPVKPLAYAGYSPSSMTYGIGTEESNNLKQVIGPLPAHEPALVYPNKFTGQVTYIASTSGKCFSGTPPTCN
jgi:hypothetical protein